MIRKAVGAIVIRENKFLIVAKVKEMNTSDGPTESVKSITDNLFTMTFENLHHLLNKPL